MKYYVAFDPGTALFQVKYGYGLMDDPLHSSYFKHSIAINTANELNNQSA